MSKLKSFLDQIKEASNWASECALSTANQVKTHIGDNKEEWRESTLRHVREGKKVTETFAREGLKKTAEQARSLYVSARYSKTKLKQLENNIENQGAAYRESQRNRTVVDALFLGGESMAVLLSGATTVPDEIEAAFAAAYPQLAADVAFLEHARTLDDTSLIGLVNGVKGKLFEHRYVNYLNEGVLPDGYSAELATSVIESGWDIAIKGPNQEVSQLLQAKATDSIHYVKEALERYPSIDVVTTDEVYSHLVMTGVSENIFASGILNEDLTTHVESAVAAGDIDFAFMPPAFTLALIAFTSYRDESLSLYEKAKSAGDRSAKAYFCYLIGGGIAAITNTWWLGVLGSVSSRYVSDGALKKVKLIETLERTSETNQIILDRLKQKSAGESR